MVSALIPMLKNVGVAATTALMRALPRRTPFKTRLTSMLLTTLSDGRSAIIHGNGGLKYWVPSLREPITVGIVAFGAYELETIDFVIRELPDDGLFVDVGANIGAITLPVAKAKPGARVLAIEASKSVFAALKRNIQENALDNVRAVCAFAGEADYGEIAFYEPPDRKFGMGSAGAQFHRNPRPVLKRAIDNLLEEFGMPMPDVIKIDVEGAELITLKGMERTLCRGPRHPVLVFEFADWAEARIEGQRPGDAQRFLLDRGFELREAASRGAAIQSPIISGEQMIVARYPS